jgi:hypothetical protein
MIGSDKDSESPNTKIVLQTCETSPAVGECQIKARYKVVVLPEKIRVFPTYLALFLQVG